MIPKYLQPLGQMFFDGDGGGSGGGNAPDGKTGGYGAGGHATSGAGTSQGQSSGQSGQVGAASGQAGQSGSASTTPTVPIDPKAQAKAKPAQSQITDADDETQRRRAIFRAIGVPGALAQPMNSLF